MMSGPAAGAAVPFVVGVLAAAVAYGRRPRMLAAQS
jgi:hypothetical protein